MEVRQSITFEKWLRRLRDLRAAAIIARRIDRLGEGYLGDVKPVGDGVSELRVNYGPGYRVYFVRRGEAWIMLLCGGDKSSQSRDIAAAKIAAKELGT